MANNSNQEFQSLINSLLDKQTFSLRLTNGQVEKFKPLTTAQLKDLIKTVVDTTLTQVEFNNTVLSLMQQCSVGLSSEYIETLNVVDKILFLLQTRISSISPTITFDEENGPVEINLEEIKTNLLAAIEENSKLFLDHEIVNDNIALTVGIPTLKTEFQANEEIYKNATVNADNQEDVRKLLGEAFVIELTKAIKVIKIENDSFNLASLSFVEKQKLIESLPASAIQKVINYVESYKRVVNQCLIAGDKQLIIDGSLFSIQ